MRLDGDTESGGNEAEKGFCSVRLEPDVWTETQPLAGGDDLVVEADAYLPGPEHKWFISEGGEWNLGVRREEVICREHCDQWFLIHRRDDDLGRRLCGPDKADVETPVVQRDELPGGVELADVDLHVGVLRNERPYEWRQDAVER